MNARSSPTLAGLPILSYSVVGAKRSISSSIRSTSQKLYKLKSSAKQLRNLRTSPITSIAIFPLLVLKTTKASWLLIYLPICFILYNFMYVYKAQTREKIVAHSAY